MENKLTLTDILVSLENNEKTIEYVDCKGEHIILTYKALIKECRRNAFVLKEMIGIIPGDRVIVHTGNSLEFIKLFWSLVITGAIIVPVTAPAGSIYNENSQEIIRFQQICKQIAPKIVLCGTGENQAEVERVTKCDCSSLSEIECTNFDDNKEEFCDVKPEDIGLIVFTSGSTGIPKGVPLTHANILAGIKADQSFLQYNETKIILNWFPLEHVVPLIVYHILPMYIGMNQIQVASSYITEDICRWLILVSELRVNSTWAPDFAYAMLYGKREEIDLLDLDLSCIEDILNGGEAINYKQDQMCMQWLRKKGLKEYAMVPIWGMSEATVGITLTRKFGDNIYKNAVSVGRVMETYQVRIRRENETICEDEIEGEIQVKGPAVFNGYLGNLEEAFSSDGWLLTGDIGVWKNGEIVIGGRSSEKIIVNGINISTNEIGNCIRQNLPNNENLFVRAWAKRNMVTQKDELYIFIDYDAKERCLDILNVVRERFQLSCDYIVYVPKNNVKRTALGKVNKIKMFEAFEREEYEFWSCKTKMQQAGVEINREEWPDEIRMMMELWAYVLSIPVDSFTPNDSFFVLGGNSAKVSGVIHKINELFKVSLSAMEFVKYDTVSKLIQYIESCKEMDSDSKEKQNHDTEVYVF